MAQHEQRVGPYQILGTLGRGGMGVVYLARHTGLERLIALKEIAGLGATDPVMVQRFVRESQLAGSLSHPNIVVVHDLFEHDGLPYIAMELIEGGSLRSYVAGLTLAQIAGVLKGILAGLSHAARHGIVHRDIKPENVLVTVEGAVKLADFGLAKALDSASSGRLTSAAVFVGTLGYAAPEQTAGGPVGPRADLYSVGAVAHELLVGVPPRPALARLAGDVAPAPQAIDPELDDAIARWVERALARDPADRFEDAATAWQTLEEHVVRVLGPHWERDARLPELGIRVGEGACAPSEGGRTQPAWSRAAPAASAARWLRRSRSTRPRWGAVPSRSRWRRATILAAPPLTGVVVAAAVLLASPPSPPRALGTLSMKAPPKSCISIDGTEGFCASAQGLQGAHAVTVSPDGRNAYVASLDNSALVAFDRRADGSLTHQAGQAGCFARDGANEECVTFPALGGAESVVVSSDGRSVYVAASASSALAAFDRDAVGGTLALRPGRAGCFSGQDRRCTPARALKNADSVAISPDGRNVYVAAYGSEAVATFDRDTRAKTLVQKPGPAGCSSKSGGGGCAVARSLDGPESVTVSHDGANVYVASGDGDSVTVFDRDLDDGTLMLKPDRLGCVSSDGTGGACAAAPALRVGEGSSSIAVSPDGANVYVASAGRGIVLVLDRDERGALKVRTGTGGCVSGASGGRCTPARSLDDGWSVAVSPDGGNVYVTSLRRGAVMVFDRDDTGTLRLAPRRKACFSEDGTRGRCATARTLAGAVNVALSPDGRSVYVTSYVGDAVTNFDRR